MNDGDAMPRKPMNEDDPLVPKQVSIPNSLKLKLKRAAESSGKSESEIVRDALVLELRKYIGTSSHSQS
jgi:metal-responsive CopG/Arc/MetJ family transcriptional regulator